MKPERHIWDEGSTHRAVAGKEYDEVWDYAEELEAEVERVTQEAILWIARHNNIKEENEALTDALEHCGYDPNDCIDCGGPPHNEYCRFWKLRHLHLWGDALLTGESDA